MALRIFISGDKFLSAEINSEDIRYALFRDRAGLLRDLEDAVEPLAQCRHILPDLVIGDFSIDLGRGDPFMSQHLADGFQGYALRKRNRRAKVCRMFATCRKDMFIVL